MKVNAVPRTLCAAEQDRIVSSGFLSSSSGLRIYTRMPVTTFRRIEVLVPFLGFFLSVGSPALGSSADKPDHLTAIEKVETAKVANDVADRIMALQEQDGRYHFVKTPSIKRDYLLACSIAHGDTTQMTQTNEKLLSLTTENAEEDSAVFRIATEMRVEHHFDAFSVAAWPIRTLMARGTYKVIVRMHDTKERIDEPLKMNSDCH